MQAQDPCSLADRRVCEATRNLARAVLRRMAVTAVAIEPRIRTLVATRDDPGYALLSLHGDDGRLLLRFDLRKQPDPIWGKLTADLCFLAGLADLRTHPPGYYFVHPLVDERDIAVPLPVSPRGLPPREIGHLRW